MATQTVEFSSVTGETITAKLFAVGSDTVVDSAVSTEATNRKGVYSAAYTDVPAGTYRLIGLDASNVPLCRWWVTLTLSTATFQSYEIPYELLASAASIAALNDFDPATDTVAHVTLVDTTTTNTDMRGTDGANTTAPDNASITAILADTNELQTNQGAWATATGFATPTNVSDSQTAIITEVNANEAKLDTIDGIVDAILVDTAEIGAAGAGLTDLGGMSTTMKSQVNAEVDTALTDYDAPTNTEMVAAFTEIKGATWATTDTLEAIRDRGDVAWVTATGFSTLVATDIVSAGPITTLSGSVVNVDLVDTCTTNTDMRGTDGANTTAPDNASITAILTDTNELQADWADAGRLDTILDARASQTSLDTLRGVDSDTLKTLSDQIDGLATSAAPQLLVDTTITGLVSQTVFNLTSGSSDDNAYNGGIAIVTDSVTSTQIAVGTVSSYVGSTKTITLSADPGIFIMANGDSVSILAAIGSAPTVSQIRAEIDSNSTQLAAIVADTNELQTNQGNWVTATGFSTPTNISDAQTAIITEVNANEAKLDIIDGVVDSILVDTAEIANLNNFDPTTDVVSHVTLVDTVTTNTDMRGTDGANTTAPDNIGIAAIQAKTDNLPTDPADASDIAASFSSIAGTLTTIASYIDTEVAAIKAKTDNLPTDPATETTLAVLDGLVDAIKAVTDQFVFTNPGEVNANAVTGGGGDDAATIYSYFTAGANEDAFKADVSLLATATNVTDAQTAIIAQVDANETKIDAVKAKTDQLTFTTANQLDVSVLSVTQSGFDDIFQTYQYTESYAVDGVAPTPAQAAMLSQQAFTEFVVSGTSILVKKLDGSTTAATYTMDSPTLMTERIRTS